MASTVYQRLSCSFSSELQGYWGIWQDYSCPSLASEAVGLVLAPELGIKWYPSRADS